MVQDRVTLALPVCIRWSPAFRRSFFRLKATRNDARYQGNVSVWYPFHPFYRSPNLSVRRRFGCHDVEYVELASQRPQRQAVPAWMLDEERCAQMTIGLEPTVDLAALLRLADWLQAQDL
jgi:hypothetical protein